MHACVCLHELQTCTLIIILGGVSQGHLNILAMAFYFLDLSFYNDLLLGIIFVTYSLGHNLDIDFPTLCSLHNLLFKFPSCFFPAYISLMIPCHHWDLLFIVLCICHSPSTSLLSLCTPLKIPWRGITIIDSHTISISLRHLSVLVGNVASRVKSSFTPFDLHLRS